MCRRILQQLLHLLKARVSRSETPKVRFLDAVTSFCGFSLVLDADTLESSRRALGTARVRESYKYRIADAYLKKRQCVGRKDWHIKGCTDRD
jgi:hypothetical protein